MDGQASRGKKMIILNHEIVNYAFKYVDNLFIFLLV